MTNSANASPSMPFSTFVDKEKLDDKSKSELAKFEQAYSLQKSNQPSDALVLYKSVANACPERFETYYNMGVCQREIGQTKDAVASFEKVVQFNRLFRPVYLDLAELHEKLGQQDQAKAARAVWNQL
jgi:tetratricopeptide (TPR) repeat protein